MRSEMSGSGKTIKSVVYGKNHEADEDPRGDGIGAQGGTVGKADLAHLGAWQHIYNQQHNLYVGEPEKIDLSLRLVNLEGELVEVSR